MRMFTLLLSSYQTLVIIPTLTAELIRASVLVSFLAVVVKYPDKSNLTKIGFILAYSPRGIWSVLEKTWRQGGEVWLQTQETSWS